MRGNGLASGRPLLVALLLLFTSVFGQRAMAHAMSQTQVDIRADEPGWHLHLTLPDDRLAAAFIQAGLVPDPGPGFTRYPTLQPEAVRRYVDSRIVATSPDGKRWTVKAGPASVPTATFNEWQIDVALTPPAGEASAPFTLDYGVILHEDIAHVAVVTITQDWQGGVVSGASRLLGSLQGEHGKITVDHGDGNAWKSWFSLVLLGVHHILEGVDHLAFLATLLLTVTLVNVGRRWKPLDSVRPVLGNTLWRVTAFTIGHSLSLLATSLDWLPPAGQGIEVLIALSVAVSALHAIVPLYPRREAWVAGGFGLVHGMAFATVIREMALSTRQVVAATLGFNLGIELVQLGLVIVVLPALLAIRTSRWEPWVRLTIAVVALVAALIWAVQRLQGL
jgi:hypothetical protein